MNQWRLRQLLRSMPAINFLLITSFSAGSRLQGVLASRRGNLAEALVHFQEGLEIAKGIGLRADICQESLLHRGHHVDFPMCINSV